MFLPCIFAWSIEKEKKKLYILLYHTLTQRILSTSITCYFPLFLFLPFLPLTFNYQRSLPPLSPFSRHQVLLPSFFSIFPLYLSICLSVCPSLATSHAHSHDQSATQWDSLPFTSFTHSLAHSPALAHTLVGFLFFFIPYTVIVRV